VTKERLHDIDCFASPHQLHRNRMPEGMRCCPAGEGDAGAGPCGGAAGSDRGAPDGSRRGGPVRLATKTMASSSILRLRASMLPKGFTDPLRPPPRERCPHGGAG
jgi:hypothetical protein